VTNLAGAFCAPSFAGAPVDEHGARDFVAIRARGKAENTAIRR
jgi:hypothetical protein